MKSFKIGETAGSGTCLRARTFRPDRRRRPAGDAPPIEL